MHVMVCNISSDPRKCPEKMAHLEQGSPNNRNGRKNGNLRRLACSKEMKFVMFLI